MHNFLNNLIVSQMQHTREHAVVTKDRNNTMANDKIAIKVKEPSNNNTWSNKSTWS